MSERTAHYLIDTSVFIQAFKNYYSFQVCPGFWQSLVSLHKRGFVLSIDRVLDEICFGEEDELTVWAKKTIPKDFFAHSVSDDVIKWFGHLQVWANAQPQYSPAAKSEFAEVTDAWIIAYAGAKNLTVVTQEVYSADIKRKIPIPNVCRAKDFQVPTVDVFTMLTRLNVQFGFSEPSNPH